MMYVRRYVLVAALAALMVNLSIPGAWAGADLSNIMGVVHNDGQYYFGTENYLNQGAAEIQALGTHVIKIELAPATTGKYEWNSSWGSYSNLTDLAESNYCKTLFSNSNFTTYVMTVYTYSEGDTYWYNGPNTTDYGKEQTEIYNLCVYLMQTYKGTGKTFLLENWENDEALCGSGADTKPTITNVQGDIGWFNCRAAGVHQAMAAYGPGTATNSDVKCYCTLEVNLVRDAIAGDLDTENGNAPGWYTATNDVLPNTSVDFCSYSSYDTQYNTSGVYSYANAVQWIADHLPATAANGQNTSSVYVGEYGVPETPGYGNRTSASVTSVINNVMNTALNFNMPWTCYWVIYDNDLASGVTPPVNGNNEAVEGYWLIRPDGTPGTAWHQHRVHLIGSSPTRANTTEITSGLSNTYTSAFPSSGTNLGTGWTTNNFSGDYTITANAGSVVMQLVANPSQTPYALATVNLDTVISRGLNPGEYLQFQLQRQSNTGNIGFQVFNTNNGSGSGSGNQPLQTYSDSAFTDCSFAVNGTNPSYNWANNNTLGIRLDSADGTFATCSFYLNGAYIGSWIYETTQTSLLTFSYFAQCSVQNASFQFGNLSLYLDPSEGAGVLQSSGASTTDGSSNSSDPSKGDRHGRHR